LPLSLEEYETWVTHELENILRPVRAKASKLLDETAKAERESKEFFGGLSRKAEREMNTKRDAASYRAARMVGQGAGQALEQMNQIHTGQQVNWENLKIAKDDVSISVRSLREIRNRTGAQLSGFYILDMRSFSGVVERLAKNGERLAAFLEGEGSNLQKARTINGIIDSLKNARQNVLDQQQETINLQKQKAALESSIKASVNQSDALSNRPDLAEVLAIEKQLRKESRNFRTEVLAHLQRPIRRLREISERGDFPIEQEQRESISLYLQKPYKSFLSPATGKYLKPILENMKRAIDTGKMEFKARKTARISNQLKQLTTTSYLSEKQSHGISLLERRRKLLQKPECKTIYVERKQILSRIDSSEKELETLEARLRSTYDTIRISDQRLSELAVLAENRTREYLKRDVQLERSAPSIPGYELPK
jgi:hypothetical protein